MSYIVNERWDDLKARMTPTTWARVKAKARWEGECLAAIVKEWPDLLPKRLRPLAVLCFADTYAECLRGRRDALVQRIRKIDRQIQASDGSQR